jgi:hypothetical protein
MDDTGPLLVLASQMPLPMTNAEAEGVEAIFTLCGGYTVG